MPGAGRSMLVKADEIIKFLKLATPLLRDDRLRVMSRFIQHGSTTCLTHCLAVAYYSFLLTEYLQIPCDQSSLVRGALLHDYFLYDWHENGSSHRFHGFSHPSAALNNAARDFELNRVERNIIARHMFPLVPVPPRYRESAIVCIMDKCCSLYETFSRDAYASSSVIQRGGLRAAVGQRNGGRYGMV